MESWERIEKVIEYLGLTKNSLSKEIGLSSNVTIGRIIKEHRKASKKTLKRISDRFPEINLTWLLTGSGKMLVEPVKNEPNKDEPKSPKPDDINSLTYASENNLPTIASYNRLIDALSELVLTNKELVKTNELLVKMLNKGLKIQS
jgi:hypothetical protein